jgi:hypothetical protein
MNLRGIALGLLALAVGYGLAKGPSPEPAEKISQPEKVYGTTLLCVSLTHDRPDIVKFPNWASAQGYMETNSWRSCRVGTRGEDFYYNVGNPN